MRIVSVLPRIPVKIFAYLNVLLGQVIYINAAGFLQNLIGDWMMMKGKIVYKNHDTSYRQDELKNLINQKGYLTFSHLVNDPKIKSLSERFSSWCESNSDKESQYRLQVSSKAYNENFLVDFPEITKLIDLHIKSAIVEYYGCDFEVINVHLYRTRKPENLVSQVSDTAYGGTACWHSDGSYTDTLKVFFLLSEVKKEDGPMLLMDKERSKIIFRSHIPYNFLKHGRPNLPQFKKYSTAFTGKPGECLIVDTNRCLHRASVPSEKPRDMVTFYIGVKRNKTADMFHDIGRTGEGLTGRF